jgi:hypothetical protein
LVDVSVNTLGSHFLLPTNNPQYLSSPSALAPWVWGFDPPLYLSYLCTQLAVTINSSGIWHGRKRDRKLLTGHPQRLVGSGARVTDECSRLLWIGSEVPRALMHRKSSYGAPSGDLGLESWCLDDPLDFAMRISSARRVLYLLSCKKVS